MLSSESPGCAYFIQVLIDTGEISLSVYPIRLAHFSLNITSPVWTFHSHVKVNTVSFQQNSSDLHLTYPPFLFYLPLVNMQLWPCLFYDPNIKGSTLLFLFKSFINLTKIRVINYCFSDIIIMFVCLHNLVRRHCL